MLETERGAKEFSLLSFMFMHQTQSTRQKGPFKQVEILLVIFHKMWMMSAPVFASFFFYKGINNNNNNNNNYNNNNH